MSTPPPILIETDQSIPTHISARAHAIRDKYLYDDIKEGEFAEYFEALEKFSAEISALSDQQFEQVRSRRGLIDEDCKQPNPLCKITI